MKYRLYLGTSKPLRVGASIPLLTVVSLIDRLMHRVEVVRIDGESYRVKETKEREAQRKVERSAKAKSAMPRVQKGGE